MYCSGHVGPYPDIFCQVSVILTVLGSKQIHSIMISGVLDATFSHFFSVLGMQLELLQNAVPRTFDLSYCSIH